MLAPDPSEAALTSSTRLSVAQPDGDRLARARAHLRLNGNSRIERPLTLAPQPTALAAHIKSADLASCGAPTSSSGRRSLLWRVSQCQMLAMWPSVMHISKSACSP